MKNILLAIESCETTTVTSPVVEKTIELASAFSSKVWVLHVVPPSRQPPYNVDSKVSRNEVAAELRREHDFLQQLAKCMRERNIEATALLIEGKIVRTIMNEAERLGIDLVVVGCHKRGRLYGALLDDTEEGLLSKCARPIMFVPA